MHIKRLLRVRYPRETEPEEKLQLLGNALERAHNRSYDDQYLGQAGSQMNWYLFENEELDLDRILTRFREANRRYVEHRGARPQLREDGHPVIHRVVRPSDNVLVVELGALDSHRSFQRNWVDEDILVDHIYRISVGNIATQGQEQKVVLEIRSATARDAGLFGLIQPHIGLQLQNRERCRFTSIKEAELKAALNARSARAYGEHDHERVSRSALESNPDTDLQGTQEYRDWTQRDAVHETAHAYTFTVEWPDGYRETNSYKIDHVHETLFLNAKASEFAIQYLRNHVAALFP